MVVPGIIDTQNAKTVEAGGIRGFDSANKVRRRKRHIRVEAPGLILKGMHPIIQLMPSRLVRALPQPSAQLNALQ